MKCYKSQFKKGTFIELVNHARKKKQKQILANNIGRSLVLIPSILTKDNSVIPGLAILITPPLRQIIQMIISLYCKCDELMVAAA